MNEPRATPAPVKRQLRQESGFGCCKCGLPILQYHHIVEWSTDKHFRPEDMMVLCPTHHDEATKGAMSVEQQRRLKAKPFNIERGYASGPLSTRHSYPVAAFGPVEIFNEGPMVIIDETPLVEMRVEDGAVFLGLTLFDQSDNCLVRVADNEWISGDPLAWDIEADWQKLIIRQKKGQIALCFDSTKIPSEISGTFWKNGKSIDCKPGGVGMGNLFTLQNFAIVGGPLKLLSSGGASAGEGGNIVTYGSRRERLYRGKEVFQRILRERRRSDAP